MKGIMKGALAAGIAAALMAFAVPAAASAQQIYEVSELTEKPRIASPMAAQQAIQRAYSHRLQSQGIEGRVVLQFVVLSNGTVDAGSVVVRQTEEPALSDAAKAAIGNIEFVPGMVGGSAVATRVVFPITFVAG